jgi:hypothetical protein
VGDLAEEIFSGFGIRVLSDGTKYFIEYDAGGLAVIPRTVEVTQAEAAQAQLSERDAYEVLAKK